MLLIFYCITSIILKVMHEMTSKLNITEFLSVVYSYT